MSTEFTALRAYHQEWEDRVEWCERALRSLGIVPFEPGPTGAIVQDAGIRLATPEEQVRTINKLLAQIQRMAKEIANLQKENNALDAKVDFLKEGRQR